MSRATSESASLVALVARLDFWAVFFVGAGASSSAAFTVAQGDGRFNRASGFCLPVLVQPEWSEAVAASSQAIDSARMLIRIVYPSLGSHSPTIDRAWRGV